MVVTNRKCGSCNCADCLNAYFLCQEKTKDDCLTLWQFVFSFILDIFFTLYIIA